MANADLRGQAVYGTRPSVLGMGVVRVSKGGGVRVPALSGARARAPSFLVLRPQPRVKPAYEPTMKEDIYT